MKTDQAKTAMLGPAEQDVLDALHGLAFAAYEAGASGATLGDCEDVRDWIARASECVRAEVAAERERITKLIEDAQRQWPDDGLDGWLLAAEIRAA